MPPTYSASVGLSWARQAATSSPITTVQPATTSKVSIDLPSPARANPFSRSAVNIDMRYGENQIGSQPSASSAVIRMLSGFMVAR